MSELINIDVELMYVLKNYWKLDYNNLYINLGNTYTIRITKVKGAVWFEVGSTTITSRLLFIFITRLEGNT